MTANRIKKSFIKIPETLREAGRFILEIAERQKCINEAKRDAKKRIDEINKKLAEDVSALKLSRDTAFNALFAFAQPRKAEFTEELRTVKLPEGSFGWRWTPPSVAVKNGMSDADVIAYLERHELSEYVRIVKEVNREALLRDRLEIPFIRYEQREEFFAKPKLAKGEGSAEELTRTDAIDR